MMLEKWLSTGVSAPDRVLDRDTWESQSDADRQSTAGTPVKVCHFLFDRLNDVR